MLNNNNLILNYDVTDEELYESLIEEARKEYEMEEEYEFMYSNSIKY